MSQRVVLGFQSARLEVDGGKDFYLGFVGQFASHNGQIIDLNYKASVTLVRERVGDDPFLLMKMKKEQALGLIFDCCLKIERVSPSTIEVTLDKRPPFALGVNPLQIQVGDQITDFSHTNLYQYQRTSGDSPRYAALKLRSLKVKVWFANQLTFTCIPIIRDPFHQQLDSFRPVGVTTNDRMKAYKYQQSGLRALRPIKDEKGEFEEWEPVVLTKDEKAGIEAARKAQRQAEFEKKCGC